MRAGGSARRTSGLPRSGARARARRSLARQRSRATRLTRRREPSSALRQASQAATAASTTPRSARKATKSASTLLPCCLLLVACYFAGRLVQLLEARRPLELGRHDPLGVDGEEPRLGAPAPPAHRRHGRAVGVAGALVELDVDELGAAFVPRVEIAHDLQLRPAEAAGAVAGEGGEDEP